MELAFWIYLISTIGNINKLIGFILAISLIIAVVLKIGYLAFYSEYKEDKTTFNIILKKFLKFFKFITLPAILIGVLLPSTTTMYTMLGVVVGEKLIQTDEANIVLNKSYELLTNKLDEAIQETQETNNE